jgi:hypothetical protein
MKIKSTNMLSTRYIFKSKKIKKSLKSRDK